MNEFPKISRLGERGILVNFRPEISEDLLGKIIFFKNLFEKSNFKQRVEINNTYHSLLIYYPLGIDDIYNEILTIKSILDQPNIEENFNSTLFHLPVCYEKEFGLDLELISNEKKLNIDRIIALHTNPVYTVYFIGFLPGFLYLGGLDPNLQISRKNTPRMEVPKGAVGIGEKQTGIYPKKSPGGWQIIGNSPVPLFRKFHDPPCLILPGDRIKFYSVSKEEYFQISKEIKEGKFTFKSEKYDRGN